MSLPSFLSLRFNGSPLVPYEKAWELQKSIVEKRAADEIPDTFLFVEHPPTITRGRGLQRSPGSDENLRAVPLGPLPIGTEYFEIERGGDLTWHGPGQLVLYPIVKLDGNGFGADHDVTGYLRSLEAVCGKWFEKYGLRTEGRENAAGIWVIHADQSAKKIASIGIAVRKWVTYHGIGLNLANSLEGYRDFSPCGFDSGVMTTLAAENEAFSRLKWSPATRARVEEDISALISPGARVSISQV